MAVRYEFRCSRCGVFDMALPMGAAPAAARCGSCGGPAARRYGAALLSGRSPLRQAREAASRSADEPALTSGPPAAQPAPGRADPRRARLPRP